MNLIKRFLTLLLVFTFIVLVLLACESINVPVTRSIETPQPYAAAQSTLEYGQSQMEEISHQATMIGMEMDQAANAAEQATRDSSQQQMMELAYQATAVSLNMAQAIATQQFIAEQTQMVINATTNAQNQAVAATYSAYSLYVTQTAQAQAIIDVHAAETVQALTVTQQFDTNQTQIAWYAATTAQSQAATATYSTYIFNTTQTAQAQEVRDIQATNIALANAAHSAYSLTATPWAAVQAEIVRTRDEANRRALWGEFVVTPLKVILITLVVLLFIMGGVIAYWRLLPLLELRLRTIWRHNNSPLLLADGMIVDHAPLSHRLTPREPRQAVHPQLPSYNAVQVQLEIVGPSEPSVTNWITEAEEKLRANGWRQP